jgi:crotonobetainyl-CoA:carnitine CoA-transferase CaiB-like acyl-CoA transferase
MQDATGIVVDGTVNHIDGRAALEDAETAIVRDMSVVSARLAKLQESLEGYDYIGVKIATGRATVDEYAEQIAQMDIWANEINELKGILQDPNGVVPGTSDEAVEDDYDDYDDLVDPDEEEPFDAEEPDEEDMESLD